MKPVALVDDGFQLVVDVHHLTPLKAGQTGYILKGERENAGARVRRSDDEHVIRDRVVMFRHAGLMVRLVASRPANRCVRMTPLDRHRSSVGLSRLYRCDPMGTSGSLRVLLEGVHDCHCAAAVEPGIAGNG